MGSPTVKIIRWALCPLLALGAAQALACYTVYDEANRLVYQSQTPPVDMSRPLHETLPARFPGGHMIFDAAAECPVINSVAQGAGGRTSSSISPLLTEQRTASALRLPHTTLAPGVALVQPRDAVITAGVTVVPSGVSARPPTAVMGAGPRPGPTITELRDPPITIIEQSNRRVTVRPPAR